jgi:hypothetical protein
MPVMKAVERLAAQSVQISRVQMRLPGVTRGSVPEGQMDCGSSR